jgi:hypothetical protein
MTLLDHVPLQIEERKVAYNNEGYATN